MHLDKSIKAGVLQGTTVIKHCSAFMYCSETALTPVPQQLFPAVSEENPCAGVKQLPVHAHKSTVVRSSITSPVINVLRLSFGALLRVCPNALPSYLLSAGLQFPVGVFAELC